MIGEPRVLATFMLSALMVSLNWGVYIYAVAAGHIVDASLGYFINPLISVLLGNLVLRERLSRVQLVAVLVAAPGLTVPPPKSSRTALLAPSSQRPTYPPRE